MTGPLPKQELSSPPDRYITCYVASKLIHSEKIIELGAKHKKIHFTARWPVYRNISSQQARPAQHYLLDNVDDILRSETVLVYVEPEDHLKGGLVEIGIAWAHGKEIYLAGDHTDFSKWQLLPRVHREHSLEAALSAISSRANYSNSESKILLALTEIREFLGKRLGN